MSIRKLPKKVKAKIEDNFYATLLEDDDVKKVVNLFDNAQIKFKTEGIINQLKDRFPEAKEVLENFYTGDDLLGFLQKNLEDGQNFKNQAEYKKMLESKPELATRMDDFILLLVERVQLQQKYYVDAAIAIFDIAEEEETPAESVAQSTLYADEIHRRLFRDRDDAFAYYEKLHDLKKKLILCGKELFSMGKDYADIKEDDIKKIPDEETLDAVISEILAFRSRELSIMFN